MLAFLGLPGGSEWIIILRIALLRFGSRLPSVMRSLGKSVTEFKKGLNEPADEYGRSGEITAGDESDDHPAHPAG
jgi:sec-independent protein translocase protein TatA